MNLRVEDAKRNRVGSNPFEFFREEIPKGYPCLAMYDFKGWRVNMPAHVAIEYLRSIADELEERLGDLPRGKLIEF